MHIMYTCIHTYIPTYLPTCMYTYTMHGRDVRLLSIESLWPHASDAHSPSELEANQELSDVAACGVLSACWIVCCNKAKLFIPFINAMLLYQVYHGDVNGALFVYAICVPLSLSIVISFFSYFILYNLLPIL